MSRETRARRGQARAREKLTRELEQLASLEPGGAPERPIDVDSAALVEMRAVAAPCPLCSGLVKLEDHAARTIDGARLRVATVLCTACGVRRARYFRLDVPAVH
jgi:hypothetical protein